MFEHVSVIIRSNVFLLTCMGTFMLCLYPHLQARRLGVIWVTRNRPAGTIKGPPGQDKNIINKLGNQLHTQAVTYEYN